MSVSISGVNMIDRRGRRSSPMSQVATFDDEECKACGSKIFYDDPRTGATTCRECGLQKEDVELDTSSPNWSTDEGVGGGSKRSSKKEYVPGVSSRFLRVTRPAGDAIGSSDSQKTREIKEEIDRIVDEEESKRVCKKNVEILNRK